MFEAFPKMARLNRDIVITEKIDGTNAQIFIAHRAELPENFEGFIASQEDYFMFAGSRTRLIQPGKNDNAGFAGWVSANVAELFKLGPGRHFGEWWGKGIQRGYALDEKRFSLFNTARWSDDATRPACCHVVPTLYEGPFSSEAVSHEVKSLAKFGSVAAPGYMDPEGVVIFHTAASSCFKVTIKGDDKPKGQVNDQG